MFFKALILLNIVANFQVNGYSLGNYARVVGRETVSNTSYDFIIAGGGIAGLTLADRLTENPNTSVLVVEYGPFDQGEATVLIPGAYNPFPYLWQNIFSTPQAGLNNATFFAPMGAVVGGGSAVNAMFFIRCAKDDCDSWESLGGTGWGWDDLLPYYKKSENFTRPGPAAARDYNISWTDAVHGFGGPVQASYPPFNYAGDKNFWDAATAVGIEAPKDPNDGSAIGLFSLLKALDPRNETRSYARIAHYDMVIGSRPNYHLLAENVVSKVLFKEKKAIGIEYMSRSTGAISNVTANKEVIIAAGAVHAPQILHLSGIGPKAYLQGLGINTIVDLPGVGQNLQDHMTLDINYSFQSNIEPNAGTLLSNTTYDAEQLALYESSRQGAYTLTRQTAQNFIQLALGNATSKYASIASLAQSENPASFLPANTDPTVLAGYVAQRKILAQKYTSFGAPVGSISWNTGPDTTIYMVKPFSRGSITLNTTDPLANPLIDFGSLKDPVDLEVVLALVRKNRELMATPPMQVLGPTELSPGANLTTDAQLKTALRGLINPSNAHMCCTAAMMDRELGGVVDEEMKVYGVTGLRVAGVSVFSLIPGSAPQATVYGMAEKLADTIKKQYGIAVSNP